MDNIDRNPILSWLKPKVLGAFVLLLGVSILSVIITYRGFWDLSINQQQLGLPGQKFARISRFINELYAQEADLRIFILTSDSTYLQSYEQHQHELSRQLAVLKRESAQMPRQNRYFKQIERFLAEKRQVVDELVKLREDSKISSFYDEVLAVLNTSINKGQKKLSTAKTVTIENRLRDTVITVKSKSKTFFGAIKRFFVGPERVDTISSQKNVSVVVDTLDYGAFLSDSILVALKSSLSELRRQKEAQMADIGGKELELLHRDREIVIEIQNLLKLLERQELVEEYRLSARFSDLLNRTLIKLLVLGAITLVLFIILIAVIFRDISRGNLYRVQLLEAKRYAERLLRVKELFLANMSHEIRTPLSAIIGLSRQLKKTELTLQQDQLLGTLDRSANHLLSVINDILDYSKLEAGKLQLAVKRFEPKEVVEEVIELLEPKAAEKGLLLHANFDPAVPQIVWGDNFRLRQVLLNLLGNSLRFTREGSIIITLSVVRQTQEHVRLLFTVADTGIGIPEEGLARIFDEFTQADGSVSRKYGGTGLGLTIVKRLVEIQGGEVSLSSKENEGTIVKFSIPYALKGKDEEVTKPRFSLPGDIRVLVIDDDEVNRMIVTEMLKGMGVEVESMDGPFGLEDKLRSTSFSVVLTDIHMPEINGYDVVGIVERIDRSIPVVALTANSMVDSPQHFTMQGFSGYLIKPFVEDDLLEVLAPLVGLPMQVTSRKSKTKKHSESSSGLYDFSDLYRFTGGDPKAFGLIIRSFLENTRINMELLTRAVKAKKLSKAAEIAHKMKSGFSQFKIYHIAALLQKIEQLRPEKHKAATVYLERINRQLKPILKEMERILSAEERH